MSSGSVSKHRLTTSAVSAAGVSGSIDPTRLFAGGVQPRVDNISERENFNTVARIGGIDGGPVSGLMQDFYKAGKVNSLQDANKMAVAAGMNVTGAAELITSMHWGQFADTESMSRGVDPRHWKLMFAARIPKPLSTKPADLMFCTLAKVNQELRAAWEEFVNSARQFAYDAADAEPHPNSLAARMHLGKRLHYETANHASINLHPLNRHQEAAYNARFLEEFSSKYAYLGVSMAGNRADPPESLQHSVRQLLTICAQGRVTHLKDIFGKTKHGDRLYLALVRPNTGTELDQFDVTRLEPLKIVPMVMREGAGAIFTSGFEPLVGFESASEHNENDCVEIQSTGDTPWRGHAPQHIGLAPNIAYNGNRALFQGARCGIKADPNRSDIYSPDMCFIDVRMITPHHANSDDSYGGQLIRRGTEVSAGELTRMPYKEDRPLLIVTLATALRYYIGFVENTEAGERGSTDLTRHNALENAYVENTLPGAVSIFAEM